FSPISACTRPPSTFMCTLSSTRTPANDLLIFSARSSSISWSTALQQPTKDKKIGHSAPVLPQKAEQRQGHSQRDHRLFDQLFPVVLPLGAHPFFAHYIGNNAVAEVVEYSFRDIYPVCQQQRQPMGKTVFAVPERKAPELSTQPRRRLPGPENSAQPGTLIGVKHFHLGYLLGRTSVIEPTMLIARVFLHRVGWVVLRVCVHAPSFNAGVIGIWVFHGHFLLSVRMLCAGRRRYKHRFNAVIEFG